MNGWTKLATSSPVTVQGVPTLTTTLRPALGLAAVATAQTLPGGSIGVAIIDSGITPSADFDGRITGFYNLRKGRGGVTETT